MTMFSKDEVIANLREKKTILEDQIIAARIACQQMDTIDIAHKADELAKLPNRILSILEEKT